MTAIAQGVFQARNYDLTTIETKWFDEGKICDMRVKCSVDSMIAAFIMDPSSKCEPSSVSVHLLLQDVSPDKQNFLAVVKQYIDFVANEILPLHLKTFFIITDGLKARAFNDIRIHKNVPIVYFKLSETPCKLLEFKFQPQQLRVLVGEERKQFIANNPNYKRTLQILPVFDILVRYMGYKHDDIVAFFEKDTDIGLVPGVFVVLRESVPFRNPERKNKGKRDA